MSALDTKSAVGWRGLEGIGGEGQVQRGSCSTGKKKSGFVVYFGIIPQVEHVSSSSVSEVNIVAERDTAWGLGLRAVGEGSRGHGEGPQAEVRELGVDLVRWLWSSL